MMMPAMRLEDLVRRLDAFDEDSTICARKPWTRDSSAQLVKTDDDGRLPTTLGEQGLAYFLEVHIARDILADYVELKPRSLKEKLDFLIYYAENDAFPDI
jgi:hypothetical protein